MKDLLLYTVQHLVDNPEEISIEESERDGMTVLSLRVAQGDLGKVIGRSGRMAKDLRAVVRASCRNGQRVMVDILDD